MCLGIYEVHWSGRKYVKSGGVHLQSYTDSDLARGVVDRKRTSGCCFNLGSTMIWWFSWKQSFVVLNLVELKYMVANLASCDAIWLCRVLIGLFGLELDPTMILYDNWSCIKLSKNRVFHDRSKHIEIKYHFIRDRVRRGVAKLQYISIDILTKPLVKGKFVSYKDKLGLDTFLASREY